MLFGLVAYAVVVAIALLDPRGGQASTLLLIQGVIILINAGSAIWVLQAHQRMAGPAIASLVINLLQIPALLLLVRDPGDIYLFAAYTLPFSLALVGYYFWYLQHHGILAFADVRLRLRAAASSCPRPGRWRCHCWRCWWSTTAAPFFWASPTATSRSASTPRPTS